MLIYQLTKNKLMPIVPMDLETLNYYLHTKNDYVNKLGVVYNKAGQKICEVETYSFVEKEIETWKCPKCGGDCSATTCPNDSELIEETK